MATSEHGSHRAARRASILALASLIVSLCAWSLAVAAPADGCRAVSFEGDRFTVCRYAPGEDEIRLVWHGASAPLDSLRGLQASLGPDAARVVFAMNAGMYDTARRPVGLFIANGHQEHPLETADGAGNFFLKPNGVFWVDSAGAPHVDDTAVFAAGHAAPTWATQSGPLLVRADALHPKIAADGASLLIRNGVGVHGKQAFFAISDGPVSFGRFARLFRDALACPDALYFDGAVSSLWSPSLGRQDGRTGLGTFVVVLRRRAEPTNGSGRASGGGRGR